MEDMAANLKHSASPIAARPWWVALLAALPPLAMLLFLNWNPYVLLIIAGTVTVLVAISWGSLCLLYTSRCV